MKLPVNPLSFLPPVMLMVLFGAMIWLGVDRDIEKVQVDGALTQAEQAEVMALVRSHVDGGVLSADIDDLANRLRGLSWPSAVGVRRVWPDRLVVSVRKAAVIARWSDDRYLTSAGEVVTLPTPRSDLPILECAHAEPLAAMEMYRALAAAAAPVRLSIAGLRQNLLGEWTVRFDNGVSLSLGRSQVGQRMDRFTYAYARTLRAHLGAIAHIDARYANGLAVRFSELIAGNTVDADGY